MNIQYLVFHGFYAFKKVQLLSILVMYMCVVHRIEASVREYIRVNGTYCMSKKMGTSWTHNSLSLILLRVNCPTVIES